MLHGPREWLPWGIFWISIDDDDASSSRNDYVDPNALNEELSIVCEKLLEKYNLLKKKSFELNKENKDLGSKLDLVLQVKEEIQVNVTHLNTNLTLP